MRDEIGEFTLFSPPIPLDRGEYLNGHITDPKRQLWSDPDTRPLLDGEARVPAHDGDIRVWALPVLPTDKEFLGWPKWEREKFQAREWDRRKNGVWFFNAGVPTWLPGIAYFYLTYYHLDVGLPVYREADRQFWWVWYHCLTSPRCYGLYYQTRRQQGKSYKLGCIALEGATRVPHFHAGLQSKTEADAKKLFLRAIVTAWKKLPIWFSPLYAGTTSPKEEMVFEAPARQGKAAVTAEGARYKQAELNSRIDFASSVETAYDGPKLGFFGNDEVGKDQTFDPLERWDVVKKQQSQAGRVIGKSLATTTSSQKDSDEGSNRRRNGLATAGKFWKDSDHTKLDPADPYAETETGLYRLMQPAYHGHIVDTHGRDVLDAARADFQRRRDRVKHDAGKLLGETRANPFDAHEMLLPDGSKCAFDPAPIVSALQAIGELDRPAAQPYRMRWNADKTAVLCEPHQDGRWLMVPEAIPRPDRQNRAERGGQQINSEGKLIETWRPLQGAVYVLSTDPIDRDLKDLARLDQASNAAAHIGWKLDVENERDAARDGYWPSGGFIAEYCHRPDKEVYREDLVMACHFFGCRILPENSRGDIRPYFRRRGYAAFIDKPPKDMTVAESSRRQGGVPPTASSNLYRVNKLAHLVDEWLAKDWRYVPFARTLNDMLRYDPDNTKEFDLASSASLCASALIPSAIRPRQPVNNTHVATLALGFAF